jgi:carbon-monoxide dehydrogenase medium subunit
MASFELAQPFTLDEALGLLDHDEPSIRPMGGGTALMLMMKAQLFQPQRLVSLRRLGAPFTGIGLSEDGGSFRIGAMTTFSELEHSPAIRAHLPVIAETMKTLANVRVRNVATVGGNLAHGDPHLDLPPVWMALGAEALIVSRAGERVVPVDAIFAGYYETTIANGELIAELRVPVRPSWRSTYVKVTTRAVHDWPALGIAISAEITGQRVNDIRIVLSAALDKPTRLAAAETVLRGAEISEALLARAGDAAVQEVEIETDNRGSAAYKNHLLRIHLARAIQTLAEA